MTTFEYDRSYNPDSSFITAIYYSADNRDLVVGFKNGSFSGYSNVSIDDWLDFVDADSAGAHYNKFYSGSVAHSSFNVTSVNSKPVEKFKPLSTWNDTAGKTAADAKDFTVTLKIKATDIIDAATKVHGFTSEPFTILSLSEG